MTKEEKRNLMIHKAMSVFYCDIDNSYFDTLEELYYSFGITWKDINIAKDSMKLRKSSIGKSIYEEIAYALSVKIAEEKIYSDMFKEAYYKRYPDCEKTMKKIAELCASDREMASEECSLYFKNFKGFLLPGELAYFVLFEDPVYMENMIIPREIIKHEIEDSIIMDDADIYFKVTMKIDDSDLYGSPLFERYILKKEKSMAEHLKVDIKDLYKELEFICKVKPVSDLMGGYNKKDVSPEDINVSFDNMTGLSSVSRKKIKMSNFLPATPLLYYTENLISRRQAVDLMLDHRFSPRWIIKMIHEADKLYSPDIKHLFRILYLSKAQEIYDYVRTSGREEFSRRDLLRSVDTPAIDLIELGYMYNMDILINWVDVVRTSEILHFNWDKDTDGFLYSENKTLKDKIRKQENLINTLRKDNKKIVPEKVDLNKNKDNLEDEIRQLKKELKRKDQKLSMYEDKIDSMEELIKDLQGDDDIDDTEIKYDLDFLKSKKYVFVGEMERSTKDLKKIFPDSLFLSESTYDITGVKADAVVLFTKWTNHGLLYKINAAKETRDIRRIICRTTNYEKIFSIMQKEMEKDSISYKN